MSIIKLELPDIGYLECDTSNGDVDLIVTNTEVFNDEEKIGGEIWPELYNKYRYHAVGTKLAEDMTSDFKAMYFGEERT